PGTDPRIGLAAGLYPAERLLHLVDEEDRGCHGISDTQRLPCPLFRLAHETSHQRPDIQDQRRASRLVAQGTGECRFPNPGYPQQEHPLWTYPRTTATGGQSLLRERLES